MTIDGRQLLVRTRLSFEPQFTGKSNTNDSVWEHVKAKFEASTAQRSAPLHFDESGDPGKGVFIA